ncbi:NB-ARC domain-containing protein [Abeliophyllum distichum]|uniref:NB-ARC domain-containing protein n=1 Tax=Abeliophyllum distichum TaxID=126358 RepID=A0ABD1V6K9_9LAMI
MAPSTYNLRRVLESRSKNEWLEMFAGQGRLVLTVTHYILKLCSEDDKIIASIQRLDDSAKLCWGYSRRTEEDRNFSILFKSYMAEFKVFLNMPKCMSTNLNERVAVFIDLLLEILEEILGLQPNFISRFKDKIITLKMELKFLITFLGDTPLQNTELETTKNVLTDIEVLANEIGSFLHSYFFTTDQVLVNSMNLALSDLLGKVEPLKEKIKHHCITASNTLPGDVTPTTAVVSLFLVDSLLDDLKDLMNHKDDRIVYVKDQMTTILDELMLLRSLLADMEVQQHLELEGFLIQIRDIAYEVEYIINSYAPVWYLTLRLPQVMEKIQLIKMPLQEMIYDARMPQSAQYPSQQSSLQVQYPLIGEEIFVGFEDEVNKIREQLLGWPEHLQIISISGTPGLGKTMLAKKLYHDPNIVYHFDKRAWCVVTQTYQRRDILIDILTSMCGLNKDAIMDKDDDTLGEKLYISLKGRRYLIVMDDVWNVNAWGDMKRYFPDDKTQSRILFTTRYEDLASKASTHAVVNHLHYNQLESLNISFDPSYVLDDASPDFTSLPLNLRKLTLRNFDLSWKKLKIIGELPRLEVLKLRDVTIEGKQWDASEEEFQELRFLELDGVQIEHWNASSDHFPKLEQLVLRSCQHLEIPSDLGFIPCLLKIEVHGCIKSVEESALQILEEQRDNGNEELKVIISHSQLVW